MKQNLCDPVGVAAQVRNSCFLLHVPQSEGSVASCRKNACTCSVCVDIVYPETGVATERESRRVVCRVVNDDTVCERSCDDSAAFCVACAVNIGALTCDYCKRFCKA